MMYTAFDWSVFTPGHHGYQRACDFIGGQALAAHIVDGGYYQQRNRISEGVARKLQPFGRKMA